MIASGEPGRKRKKRGKKRKKREREREKEKENKARQRELGRKIFEGWFVKPARKSFGLALG